MKKFMALATAAVLLVCSLASCASGLGDPDSINQYVPEVNYVITEQGTFTFREAEGETAVLVKYNGIATKDDKVVIPTTFHDRPVTVIGDEAFYNLSSVIEVTIPETVEKIGKYAFAACTELTTINLPDKTVEIDEYAFANCHKLTNVNTKSLTTIGDRAFWGCTSLATFNGGNLPGTVESIGSAAFWECTSLTTLVIPETVTKIGDLAYYNCTGLTSIKLHDGLKAEGLGKYIFTTEKSTLKDKIDLSNIAEGSDVWKYVDSIAEPAEETEARETEAPEA